MKLKAVSSFELLVMAALVAIVGTVIYAALNPAGRIYSTQKERAVVELFELAEAIQLFNLDNGYYPADTARGVDPGLSDYLSDPEFDWSEGPIPGTVWDYDNTYGETCIDSAGEDLVQIVLRNVPNRNPDGTDIWAWYLSPTPGKDGVPHCDNVNEYDKGECVNCADFDIDADV